MADPWSASAMLSTGYGAEKSLTLIAALLLAANTHFHRSWVVIVADKIKPRGSYRGARTTE